MYVSQSTPQVELFDDFFIIREKKVLLKDSFFKIEYSEVYKILFIKEDKKNWWYLILEIFLIITTLSYSPEYHRFNKSIKVFMKGNKGKIFIFKVSHGVEEIIKTIELIKIKLNE